VLRCFQAFDRHDHSKDMEFEGVSLTTERGKDVIEFFGRLYRQENPKKGSRRSADNTKLTTYWRRCTTGCSGRIKQIQPCSADTGEPSGELCNEGKDDSHSQDCVPNPASIGRKKAFKLVEHMVVSENRKIPEAVGEVISILKPLIGEMEAAQFGHAFQVKSKINNLVRRAHGHSPTTYDALTNIPQDLSVTRAGERYLLVFESYFDSAGEYCGVILAFATSADLLKLFKASVVLVF